MSAYLKVKYGKDDSVDSLSADQLELLTRTQHDLFLRVVEDTTIFDIHRVRLLLELGCIEARRRLDAIKESGND